MSSEKMHILKMLEDGKINADEASRLLQGVDMAPARVSNYSNTYTGGSQRTNGQPVGIGGKTGLDDFAADLRRKFGTPARDIEPKIQRFVGSVAEKTADVTDRISKNINESTQTKQGDASPALRTIKQERRPSASPSASGGASQRNFELKVDPGYNELNLKAHNGDISITGYNGDKLTVKIFAKESRAGANARLELMRLGNRYCLNYNESDFKTISIDALVPDKLFSNMVVGASNGQTNVANIATEYFTADSSNGVSVFRGIHAKNIKISTSNGRLNLDEISAKNASIEGSSGAVVANYLDAANLHLLSSNAGITMSVGDFRQGNDYTWIIETSNGKVSLNVPSSPRNGYHIKASTSLGNVRIGLPTLKFLSNMSNYIEAVSTGYDSAAVKVQVSVETSNEELCIN